MQQRWAKRGDAQKQSNTRLCSSSLSGFLSPPSSLFHTHTKRCSLNPEMLDWLWQTSEAPHVLHYITKHCHPLPSWSPFENTHSQTHVCLSSHHPTNTLPPTRVQWKKKTLFGFRKQINSSVGDQLWELAESLWQHCCCSPWSILWKLVLRSQTLML